MSNRDEMRRMARESIDRGDVVGWFETLYRRAAGDWTAVPWADLAANPSLCHWLAMAPMPREGTRCLVVGCGLGDDAEALAAAGFEVTAFDVSATAIEACRRRFPESRVVHAVADALDPPCEWKARFDLVVESCTLQVLPPAPRSQAMRSLASLVAPGGRLLVICRGRDSDEPEGDLPWPLTRDELNGFCDAGLTEASSEEFFDDEEPPVRRFFLIYERPRNALAVQ